MKDLILKKLKERFGESVVETGDFRNDLTVKIKKEILTEAAKFLRDDPELGFDMCKDVTAIDWAKKKNRFTMVYHIYSFNNNFELRLKADIEEAEPVIASLTGVWKSAGWYERETYDMYGIKFTGHPDLRRIYMPEEFEYHPLRKDFPLMGIPGSLPLPGKEN